MPPTLQPYSQRIASSSCFRKFKALTLDVVAKCAFALSSDCQNNVRDPFLLHSRNYFDEIRARPGSQKCGFSIGFLK
ncbi:unnamed protein product [Toxocara canis]|uniref:Uncharacterized protein n=1 Tax=Toxocara canis TaxID=6265 RepID=A0A183U0K6_TOXCA|nr:unnamed protein product [Toxocara canis]